MAIQIFTEAEVRSAVHKKAPISIKSGKRSKHETAFIVVDGKKISHFRIPNNHTKEFYEPKANEMSKKLCLDKDGYNRFVECSMTPEEYISILKKRVSMENNPTLETISSIDPVEVLKDRKRIKNEEKKNRKKDS